MDLRIFFEAQRGNLDEFIEKEIAAFEKGVFAGVQAATIDLKGKIRKQVAAALTRKASFAIQSRMYDDVKVGGHMEKGGASLLYSKLGRGRGKQFIDYLDLHVTGGTVRAKKSKWLYISLERGPKKRRKQRPVVAFDPRLAFIPDPKEPKKKLYLVRTFKDKNKEPKILAVLIRVVRIPKRLEVRSLFAAHEKLVPDFVTAKIIENYEE